MGTSSSDEKCVYRQDNSKSVSLVALPMPQEGQALSTQYADERARFDAELATVRAAIASDQTLNTELQLQSAKRADYVSEYSRIQGEYAGFTEAAGTTKIIKEVSDSLTPFRAKTAPASDLEIERKKISQISNQRLLLVQIALFIAVLVLLAYAIIPGDNAHIVAFLLLTVGVATAFFLRK